jgi:hypothetical protein
MTSETDPMASRYGNTVVVTGPEGWTKVAFNQDHTMTGVNSKGERIVGTWAVENGMLWETPIAPASFVAVGKHCNPVPTTKLGDKIEHTRPNGQKITVELVAGIDPAIRR